MPFYQIINQEFTLDNLIKSIIKGISHLNLQLIFQHKQNLILYLKI